MNFCDKTVMITGTNRGLGKTLVETFAEKGAAIIAHARKDTPEFREMISEISKKHNVPITPVFFDMTDTNAMKAVVKDLFSKKTPVDVLVNSAGVAHAGMFANTPVSKIKEIFDVNFFAQLELTQLILKIMTRKKSGCIINIASVTGLIMSEGQTAYACSKAALMTWTKNLAAECGRFGIRVNAVAPGLLDTEMKNELNTDELEFWQKHTVLRRIGTANDVASAVAFLASDDASFINGQIIRIDGGLL